MRRRSGSQYYLLSSRIPGAAPDVVGVCPDTVEPLLGNGIRGSRIGAMCCGMYTQWVGRPRVSINRPVRASVFFLVCGFAVHGRLLSR